MRRQVRRALIAAAALGASCATTGGPIDTSIPGHTYVFHEAFVVRLDTRPPVARGVPSSAQVTVTTRGGFHLNDDYPIHFEPMQASDVEFTRARFDRASGITTVACDGGAAGAGHACSAAVPLEFVARGDEQVKVGGILALSACDQEHCVIEKVTIGTVLPVVAR